MPFKPGDTVSVLDEAIEGRVLSVDGDLITLTTDEGFPLQFDRSELIKIGEAQEVVKTVSQDLSQILRDKESNQKPGKTHRKAKKEKVEPPMEVDLHIQQLVQSTRGMDNYDILTLQLETAKRRLDFAIQNRIRRVVFIHGVGQGVLRTELEFLLNRYERIKFYEADYQKYGQGATEVYILQNRADSV